MQRSPKSDNKTVKNSQMKQFAHSFCSNEAGFAQF